MLSKVSTLKIVEKLMLSKVDALKIVKKLTLSKVTVVLSNFQKVNIFNSELTLL
jgi:hypothetical protein